MEIQLLDKNNRKIWEDFIKNNPNAGIQYSLKWKETIEKSYKNVKGFYYVGLEKGKAKFIFPFFLVKSRLLKNRLISLPFLDNGGFLGKIEKKDIEKLKKIILNDLKKYKIKAIEIRMNFSIKNFHQIRKLFHELHFYEESSKQQFIVNLTSEEDMWKRFHKHTRNDIRKAIKSGLEIKRILNEEELKKFYKLYFVNMKNFGTPPHSYNFFKNLMIKLGDNFVGLNCYFKDNLAASLIMLYENKIGYIAFNVSDRKYRKYSPNDLLYWSAIKFALEKKLKKLDLGEVNKNFERGSREWGLYKFKSKWLGNLYDKVFFYYHVDYKEKNGGKMGSLKRYRKIWRKLPSFIIKIIGPKIRSEIAI